MKLRNILFAFAAFAGLVSCVKDDMTSTDGLTVFKAVYSDAPQSKTVISGLTPHWSPADKISIYDGKNNEFTNTGKSVSATASFSGTLNGKGRKHYLAAYPYSEDLTFSFMGMTVYSLNMPQEQTAVEGSYDPKAAIAVAYSTNQTLAFKNVSSLIRFKVISDGVTSVTVVPNDDTKVLAGTLNATVDGDGLRLAVTESQNTVTLSGEFKKDATYYLATLPASLENGFTVLLNGSIRSYVTDAPVNLTRSGLVDLGTLSLNPSESETPENPGGEEPAPATDFSVAGNFNGWSTSSDMMTEENGYYVLKGFKAASASTTDEGDCGFKFVYTDESGNTTWYGVTQTQIDASKWYNPSTSGSNILVKGNAADKFDAYIKKDLSSFCVVPAGGSLPAEEGGSDEPENPDSGSTCRLIVKVNKAIDWYDKYIYCWDTAPILGDWPGTKLNWDKEEGDYYVYYYDFDSGRSGKELNYIINKGTGGDGNQTKDLKVTLNGAETTVHIETSDVN